MREYERIVRDRVKTEGRLEELWTGAGRQIEGGYGGAYALFMDPYEVRALVEYIWLLRGVMRTAAEVVNDSGRGIEDLRSALLAVKRWEEEGAV